MRSRVPLLVLLLGLVSFALPHLAYASIPYFGPIVPDLNCGFGTQDTLQNAAGSWGALIIVINNIISVLITIAIMVVAPLTIGYAGFLFVVNPINPSGKEKAKSILWNTVIGIVIALSAYLIVDAILAGLTGSGKGITYWSLVTGNNQDLCVKLAGSLSQTPTGGGGGNPINPNQPLGTGTGACDPSQVQQAAEAGGYQISNLEANILACIAKPESNCGANTTGATQPNGKPTSAAGPWQNVFGYADNCHSLTIPACGNLNCHSAFSGGKPKPGMESLAQQCIAEVNNLTCAAAAAACLVQADGGYTAWTRDPRASAQQQCISQNGG